MKYIINKYGSKYMKKYNRFNVILIYVHTHIHRFINDINDRYIFIKKIVYTI